MSDNGNQLNSWKEILDYKAQLLYSQIALTKTEMAAEGAPSATIEMLCKPYYALLESLYAEDYPLARAIETSDFVVRLKGKGIDRDNPRISVISSYFGKVKKQVSTLAKAIAEIQPSQSRKRPREFDLTLTAFAKGSLVLGFSLPTLNDLEENGQPSLLGEEEPFYKAARQAMKTLGVVSHLVAKDATLDEIAAAVPDAKVRDVALASLGDLAPSGKQGISTVSVGGRDIGQFDEGVLTKQSRKLVEKVLKHPVASKETASFSGVIREIDLDVKRFELRHIEHNEINEVRCVYEDYSDKEAAEWLNQMVMVTGIVERDANEKARLMEVESIELLT